VIGRPRANCGKRFSISTSFNPKLTGGMPLVWTSGNLLRIGQAKVYLPFTPFRNSLREISKADARAARWRRPTSRAPRSRSDI
jgi:hypothetical protein